MTDAVWWRVQIRVLTSTGRLLLLGALAFDPLGGQDLEVTGYALGVGTWAAESPLGPSGATLLGRARVMPIVVMGGVTVDVAYEHVASRTPTGGGLSVTTPGGEGAGGGDWLGTEWVIRSTARSLWRHRFDRLALSFETGPVSVTLGRQAISWATTMFLTPADPFAPFDPSDPFREYRGGVDAIRIRIFPGPFSEVETVLRATDTTEGDKVTALARGQTSRGGWAFGAWAGVIHEEAAGALFATGAAGATALRVEASLREDRQGEGATIRATFGVDRNFIVKGKDLILVAEIQHDGLGATRSSDLLDVVMSKWFARGEMQVLGTWSVAVQTGYQIHPLVSVQAVALGNLLDGSTLLAPAIGWSATESMSLRLGFFAGTGPGGLEPEAWLQSEYGSIPVLGYASLSWYF
jgi:hypothetical protein